MWKKSITGRVNKVKHMDNPICICGIVIKCGDGEILLINLYMPNNKYN